jgi:hypothetical protein
MPQGFDTRINVRIVPGRDIAVGHATMKCQPRTGAPRHDADLVPLPPTLIHKLQEGNKRVMEWLANDSKNAQMFMSQPVQALLKAGIELTRAEQKLLATCHAGVRDAAIVGPGVRVERFDTAVHPKGRVGEIKGSPTQADVQDHDCGCGGKPKGKK